MTITMGEFYVPGEIITDIKSAKGITIIGPGLRRNGERPNTLCVTQSGNLCFKTPNVYWIEGHRHRYIPKKGDLVVGIVTKKSGDALKVDIGSAEFASLSILAFEGATKKQKPDVQVGDVVYAKLLNAHREMEPELICIDSYSKAGRLGVLSADGFLLNISPHEAVQLLNIDNPILRTLGRKLVYEIAVGVNGKVWINARKIKDVFNIIKGIELARNQSIKQIERSCNKIK
ncbi:exosome complex component RRP40 [Aethina tumida]|uniref:exosome complex component RRP40 n=1 Tax=Aethina tumida TaxID=116153 RepID=UPI00096AF0BD|nr:exosome complex component RRP40 [Aethina tumida]